MGRSRRRCRGVGPLVAGLLLGLCAPRAGARGVSYKKHGGGVVNYEHHGDDWEEGKCNSGWMLSPINFDFMMASPTGQMDYLYQNINTDVKVTNDGKTLTAHIPPGYGGIYYQKEWWDIHHIDFHSTSEHLFAGERRDLEMQIFHMKKNQNGVGYARGKFVIVSLTFMAAANVPVDVLQDQSLNFTVRPLNFIEGLDFKDYAPPPSNDTEEEEFLQRAPALSFLQKHRQHRMRIGRMGLVDGEPEASDDGGDGDSDSDAASAANSTNATNSTEPLPKPDEVRLSVPDPAEVDFNKQLQHFLVVLGGLPRGDFKETYAIRTEKDLEMGMDRNLSIKELMEDGDFFSYPGSITVPPCDGKAVWFVRKDALKLSNTQLKYFHDTLRQMSDGFGNYRHVQPILSRNPTLLSATELTKAPFLPPSDGTFLASGPNPRTDSEMRALWYTNRVRRVGEGLHDYIKEIDGRVQAAAAAHAKAFLVPTPKPGPNPPTEPPLMGVEGLEAARQMQDMSRYLAHMAHSAIADAKQKMKDMAFNASVGMGEKIASEIESHMYVLLTTTPPPTTFPVEIPAAAPMPAPMPAPQPMPMPMPLPAPMPMPMPMPMPAPSPSPPMAAEGEDAEGEDAD